MDRLTETKRDQRGNRMLKQKLFIKLINESYLDEVVNKLADYEDTGLTPDQIREMDEEYLRKCQEVNRLREQKRTITKQQLAVIEMYTGIVMLTGKDRVYFYRYAEKLLGHKLYTHEYPEYADVLKELAYPDFCDICRGAVDGEEENA